MGRDVEFIRVARVPDMREGRSKLVKIDGEDVALWQVGGKIYAINNVCPHQRFSMLHQGTLEGNHVTCPMHGWSFCLEDGTPKTGNGKAKVYAVRVEGDEVFVEKPGSW